MDTSAAVESAAAVRPGVYTFVSQDTGTVIDLARGSSADGTDILSWYASPPSIPALTAQAKPQWRQPALAGRHGPEFRISHSE